MRMLVLLVPIMISLATSAPMSSTSPGEAWVRELRESVKLAEPVRTRRSITALLAAEVLFLESILAAQNSKKFVKKVKARKVARPVSNQIHPTVGGKHTYPPPVRQDIASIPTTTVQTTTSQPISQLDPFIMLTAPDLSRSQDNTHHALQAYTDEIFTELIQTPNSQDGSKREVKPAQKYQRDKYGEFELYNPIIFAHNAEAEEFVTSTALTPSSTSHDSSERKPRKIIQKYGAFELYEPSFVIRPSKAKSKGKRNTKKGSTKENSLVHKKPASLPSTFFTREQVRAVHKTEDWRKVKRRRSKMTHISVDQ